MRQPLLEWLLQAARAVVKDAEEEVAGEVMIISSHTIDELESVLKQIESEVIQ